MPSPHTDTTALIADQNDRFRRGDPTVPGQMVITQGVQALLAEQDAQPEAILALVRTFDSFAEDNDPHREHDFGTFEFCGQKCFWKLDLYDQGYTYGSEAPADLSATRRVLTIMLASEY